MPVYVLDDETPKHYAMGGASRWWLHHSLASLDTALRDKGSRLILRRGTCDAVLADLAAETGATRVHAIRHYEPWWRNAERAVTKRLDVVCHDGNYLAPPGSITTGSGGQYKIYTPFWRALKATLPPPAPQRAPAHIPAPPHWPKSRCAGRLAPAAHQARLVDRLWRGMDPRRTRRARPAGGVQTACRQIRANPQSALGRGLIAPVATSAFRGSVGGAGVARRC